MCSLTEQFKIFLRLRELCGNEVPKEFNPTQNMCMTSPTGMCDMGACPIVVEAKKGQT